MPIGKRRWGRPPEESGAAVEVLLSLARLIESQADGMLCAVWLLDEDGQHLRVAAAPGLPAGYIAAMDGFSVGPNSGSCGAAVYRREPVFVADISGEPR